jgi:hypothetical protein
VPVFAPGGRAIAEVEGGEPILSRATYANNKALVDMLLDSSLNKGGAALAIDPMALRAVRFATGGVLPGGSTNSATASGSELSSKVDTLTQLLVAHHSDLTKTIQNVDTLLKAYVVTSEVGESLDDLRAIRREANGLSKEGDMGNLYK